MRKTNYLNNTIFGIYYSWGLTTRSMYNLTTIMRQVTFVAFYFVLIKLSLAIVVLQVIIYANFFRMIFYLNC